MTTIGRLWQWALVLGLGFALAGCRIEAVEEEVETEASGPEAPGPGSPGPEGPETPESPQPPKPTAPEWPMWRGPKLSGFSAEVPKALLPLEKPLWTHPMAGECNAPIAVAEGYVVVADHGAGRDYWRCFDAATGEPKWTHEYANTGEMDYGAAPRASPLIYRGKVYCLNAWGTLFCLRLSDGEVVWKKDFLKDFKAGEPPVWGYCPSPIAADGKILTNPGGTAGAVAALDPDTGETVWTAKRGFPNYAGFIVGTFGGVRQVVGYDTDSLGGWDLESGERLWTLPADSSAGYIVPTPVDVGGKLLLSSDTEETRLHAFDASGKIVAEPVAGSEELYPEMSTPVLWGKLVLGASDGLVLLDPADDLAALWIFDEDPSVGGLCHFIVSDDRALVFCDDGHVVLLALDREACKIVGKAKVCGSSWTYPAIAGGRLYVRDKEVLACYDLSAGDAKAAE